MYAKFVYSELGLFNYFSGGPGKTLKHTHIHAERQREIEREKERAIKNCL